VLAAARVHWRHPTTTSLLRVCFSNGRTYLRAAMIAIAAGMAAATTIKQGITAHASSATMPWQKSGARSALRRLLQIESSVAPNTPATRKAHIPRTMTRMALLTTAPQSGWRIDVPSEARGSSKTRGRMRRALAWGKPMSRMKLQCDTLSQQAQNTDDSDQVVSAPFARSMTSSVRPDRIALAE